MVQVHPLTVPYIGAFQNLTLVASLENSGSGSFTHLDTLRAPAA